MRFRDILMTAATASSAGNSLDDDVLLWRDAVVTNGGTVSAGRLAIVSVFVSSEKASGAWALTDDYWGLWAESAIQALTSLKQLRLAVATNSPTFTVDRGYVFNGTTNYLDTGFVPATHAVAMAATSIHAEIYERTNVNGSSNVTSFGTTSTSNRSIRVNPRGTNSAYLGAGSTNGTFTLPSANSQGLTQTGRDGAAVTNVYGARNGVDMTRAVNPSALGASLSIYSFYVGAYNNSGTATGLRAASAGFASCGAALSQAQRLARYNAVQAWATSVGAQV